MKIQYLKRQVRQITPRKKVVRQVSVPAGTLVAVRKDDKIYVGWSKISLETDENGKQDVFNKAEGAKLAEKRASHVIEKSKLPLIVRNNMNKFIESAQRYFKDCQGPIVID